MVKLTTITQPAKIIDLLGAVNIILQMERKLQGNSSVIALGILNCIQNQVPACKIIKEVREIAADNYPAMADLIGRDLLITIINF